MSLREWQKKRLLSLEDKHFGKSKYAENVTLVIYTFPPSGREDEMFAWIKSSILHSWDVLGKLPTVIVANKPFKAAEDFAAKHSGTVILQFAKNLIPGDIKTMSLDCIKNLHSRFNTPYCLIIQDDGMPLVDNLGDFLGKYDFLGAPIISDGWKRILAYSIGFGCFNGGFSLRSKRFCLYASNIWFSFFSKFMTEDKCRLGEDVYYTTLLKFLPMTWLRFRFPSMKTAFNFAVDLLGGYVKIPDGISPFGFHGRATAETMLDRGILS